MEGGGLFTRSDGKIKNNRLQWNIIDLREQSNQNATIEEREFVLPLNELELQWNVGQAGSIEWSYDSSRARHRV